MIRRLFISLFFLICAGIFIWQNPAPKPQQPMGLRFVKLDEFGNKMQPWSGPWACVLDTETGLVWENKTDNESIHDGYWTYSWFDGRTGVENLGDCYFESQRCDVSDLLKKVNQEQTCGFNSWRLPTTQELQTLIDRNVQAGQVVINPSFFVNTKRGDYWTADNNQALSGAFKRLGQGALAVSFLNGDTRPLPYRNAAFVRMVTQVSKNSHSSMASSQPLPYSRQQASAKTISEQQ